VDIFCIVEVGDIEGPGGPCPADLDHHGGELLIEVLAEREVEASVFIASNEASAAGQEGSPTQGCAS
jgi:hypothetical protein